MVFHKSFQPNRSKNGREMAKRLFQAKKGSKQFWPQKKNSAKLVKKWLKNGQNTFSRPKKGQKCGFQPRKNFQPIWSKNGQNTFSRPKKDRKCGFWPRKNFQPNWSENGQNLAKRRFLGPKRVRNVVFGPKKIFSQISQKMAKIWPQVNFQAQKDRKCGFWPRKKFQQNRSKNGRNMAKRCFHA